jgi:hypothetical protein
VLKYCFSPVKVKVIRTDVPSSMSRWTVSGS